MSLPVCTVNTSNIQSLPDSPTLAPDELKQEFDKSGKDLKDYLNEILLPAVEKLVRDEKANLEASINSKILADNKKKYPIGKIIMSTSSANPNTYIGFGTWVLWGSGRVPVGVNTSDTSFNTVEKTGGEKDHKLTVQEMPSHAHSFVNNAWSQKEGYGHIPAGSSNNADRANIVGGTGETGGGLAHNNMPPYITCYMWKRTA